MEAEDAEDGDDRAFRDTDLGDYLHDATHVRGFPQRGPMRESYDA